MIERDTETYESLLKSMATLSGLFSQSKAPYIDSRFVEKLFVLTTAATDLGRADKSFDALLPGGIGVGVKTFLALTGSHKTEKVAEFTALAREGAFRITDKEKLVKKVSQARNQRIRSNAFEYGIHLDKCVYHCLIRFEGGAIVHEEPYQLIDLKSLIPLTVSGRPADDWSFTDGKIYFSDRQSNYSYSVAKNVLMKQFNFDRNRNVIKLDIHPNPLALLDELVGRSPTSSSRSKMLTLGLTEPGNEDEVLGRDFVVLPLYSTRDGEVPQRSGINQWNAAGRPRGFGEAYVPVPSVIHERYPRFFPSRDTHFSLELPDGFRTHRAKICQAGGKALMTESNIELGRWLISVIDPSVNPSDFGETPKPYHRAYTYSDLIAIGSDSVKVRRIATDEYSIEFAPLGTYRDLVELT